MGLDLIVQQYRSLNNAKVDVRAQMETLGFGSDPKRICVSRPGRSVLVSSTRPGIFGALHKVRKLIWVHPLTVDAELRLGLHAPELPMHERRWHEDGFLNLRCAWDDGSEFIVEPQARRVSVTWSTGAAAREAGRDHRLDVTVRLVP